jgi:hypothetical protein
LKLFASIIPLIYDYYTGEQIENKKIIQEV